MFQRRYLILAILIAAALQMAPAAHAQCASTYTNTWTDNALTVMYYEAVLIDDFDSGAGCNNSYEDGGDITDSVTMRISGPFGNYYNSGGDSYGCCGGNDFSIDLIGAVALTSDGDYVAEAEAEVDSEFEGLIFAASLRSVLSFSHGTSHTIYAPGTYELSSGRCYFPIISGCASFSRCHHDQCWLLASQSTGACAAQAYLDFVWNQVTIAGFTIGRCTSLPSSGQDPHGLDSCTGSGVGSPSYCN